MMKRVLNKKEKQQSLDSIETWHIVIANLLP